MIIKNRDKLISKGNHKGRKIAIDLINHVMKEIDAYDLIKNLIHIEKNSLIVGSSTFNLSDINDIYVLGAGKAVLQMAEALEDILGEKIEDGVIIEKKLDHMTRGLERINKLNKIRVLLGDHPIPDETDVNGAREILRIAKRAGEGDLVFFCVQGGCTCMTTLPAEGLTLEDVKITTSLLLESGANISEVNAVRIPITTLSEGRLARYVHPAEIINLVVYDGIWNFPQGWNDSRYDRGWGPTVPVQGKKHNDFENAVNLLKKHDLWKKVPEAVRNHLRNPEPNLYAQTVRDFESLGVKYHNHVLATPEDGAQAAVKIAEELGLNSMILSTSIEGEAREVGIVYSAISKEIVKNGRPLKPPCVLVASGETTVTLTGDRGEGGRNQECVLSAALKIDGAKDIVIASVGTDGTDGPTPVAGGIVDGYTVERADSKGIDIHENLQIHNSSYVLRELEDAILFNEPGNNVCDLSLIIVTDSN
jgi:glycerate-2-kinase